MAEEEKKKGSEYGELWLVVGLLALLIFFWFYTGAYKNADVKGLFIAPPAPVGTGGSYGPSTDTSSDTSTDTYYPLNH